ncbi:ATP-dependent RNA helicase dbp6, partial [Schaereria dolodes]|nr:ATP-dependent RNA helicase dbp6 [Schaereria dolodes]
MATSFYARYVPPVVGQLSQHHEITDDNSSLSKKPKKRQREPELNSTGLELTSKKPKKLKTTSVRTQATQTYTSDNKKKGTKDIQYFKQANALSKDGNHTLPRHDDQITSSKRSRRSSDLDGAREDKIKRRISNFEGVDGEFIDKKPPKINHDHDLNAHLADDLEKHKKIRSKYEKSSKVATKLAKKNKASAEFSNDTGELHAEPKAETYGLVPLPQPPIIPDTLKDLGFSALPDWLAKPIVIHSSDTVPFQTFPLSSVVTASLKGKGYENTFAIQSAILPMLLPGPNHYAGDICISAPTGSGKTLTYVLPMVEALRDKPIIRLRGLIVVPTRELVAQAREAVEVCSSGTGLRVETAVGNRTLKDEQDAIIEKSQTYDPEAYREIRNRKSTIEDLMDWDDDDNQDDEYKCLTNFVVHYTSKVDILICTPGRLVDHVKFTKGFTLQHITWFVVDEADRLLDQSFQR